LEVIFANLSSIGSNNRKPQLRFCRTELNERRTQSMQKRTNYTRSTKEVFMIVGSILILLTMSAYTQTSNNKAINWNEIGSQAAATAGRGPATFIDLTYMHIAVYDAVAAIDGRFEPFAISPHVAGPASQDAAAVAAAYNVLRLLYPSQQISLESAYLTSLATIPDGTEKTVGIQVGTDSALRYMQVRAGDGRNAPVIFTPGSGPGAWVPTPPLNLPGALPWLAQMRPFSIESPSQFRAEGPPRLDSLQWAEEYNEVKRLGGINSTERTPEQTEAGRFYVEGAAGQSARAFRRLATDRDLDLIDSSRLFAMIYVSISDSLITTWDSKYYYAFWRPVTAIRAGDTDGNPLTEADPVWTPLAATPNFPEYVSAHSSVASGFAGAISAFFETKKVEVTLDSTVTGTARTFDNTDDIVKDVADARIFAGFHFRSACVHGSVIGKKVVHWVSKRHFRPRSNL
jgi:hypothetical protein